ncbi:type II secretion system minor pseudopilin GspI [Roseateles sp. BYS180W]|uniref:Type II secretion system protein I n=1 Tax=Roseateles rivi TaxID=3299028 RepID=A0ABW7FRB2_9BURK
MKPSGFTLLEVLVALAVVAITLGAGLRASAALTQNAQRMVDVSAAQWCAENELAELRLQSRAGSALPGLGEIEFPCKQLGMSYAGKVLVGSTPNPNFRRLDVVVRDEQGQIVTQLTSVMGRY